MQVDDENDNYVIIRLLLCNKSQELDGFSRAPEIHVIVDFKFDAPYS